MYVNRTNMKPKFHLESISVKNSQRDNHTKKCGLITQKSHL